MRLATHNVTVHYRRCCGAGGRAVGPSFRAKDRARGPKCLARLAHQDRPGFPVTMVGGHEVGDTAESVHSLDWFQARLGRRFLRGQDLYAATSVLTWPARLRHAVSLNPSGSPASW